jgi:hypothetical protein
MKVINLCQPAAQKMTDNPDDLSFLEIDGLGKVTMLILPGTNLR